MSEVAVIYNADGNIQMVVIPTGTTSLDDPAFHPSGCVQTRIARKDYDAVRPIENTGPMALMKATVGALAEKDAALAAKVSKKVLEVEAKIAEKKKVDADDKAALDKAAKDGGFATVEEYIADLDAKAKKADGEIESVN